MNFLKVRQLTATRAANGTWSHSSRTRLALRLLTMFLLLGVLSATAQSAPPPQGELVIWGSGSNPSDLPPGSEFAACAGALRNYLALRSDGTLVAWGSDIDPTNTGLPSGNDFVAIARGFYLSLALRADGSIAFWGSTGGSVPPGTYTAIAAGEAHAVALKTNGSLVSWGNGYYEDPPPGNDFEAISSNVRYNVALRSDGSIVGWGTYAHSTGIDPADVPEGNNFVAVSAGDDFGVALRSDGSLVAWGEDVGGVLEVPPGNDFVAISAGNGWAIALRSDGSLVGWGGGNANESFPPAGNDFVALGNSMHASYPMAIRAVPVAIAGANQTVHCTGPDGATVTLNGSASYDPDGHDALQYEWSVAEDAGVTLDHPDRAITTGTFSVGVHEVTLTVYDVDEFGVRKEGVDCDSVTIIVLDDDPPLARVTTDVASLWPPNGAMVPVAIYVEASDACSFPAALRTFCTVSSNQPDDTSGSRDRTGDVDGSDGYSAPVEVTLSNLGGGRYGALVYLRAERDASASTGRMYSISLSVEDASGNSANASTTVVVPHDGRNK